MKSSVLFYNLKDTKKGKQMAMIFAFLGFKVKYVTKADYLKSIGVLAGMEEEKQVEEYSGEGFEEEMLVLNAASEDQLDKALFLLRKEKLAVGLKAMVTPTNKEWDSLKLYEEIKQEHESMSGSKEK